MNKLMISMIIIGGMSFWGHAARAQDNAKVLSPQQVEKLVGGTTDIDIYVDEVKPEMFFEKLWDKAGLPSFKRYTRIHNQKPLVSLQMYNASFWEVVRQASEQWKLSVIEKQLDPGRRRLAPRGQPAMQGKVEVSGPFLLVADGITYAGTKKLLFDAGDKMLEEKESLGFGIDLYSDLKVPLVPDQGQLVITEAKTNSGESLLQENNNTRSLREDGQFVWHSGISLNPEILKNMPHKAGAPSTATFKGYFQTQFVAKSQTWKVTELANAKGASHSFTGTSSEGEQSAQVVACHIADVEAANEGYLLTMIFDGPNNWAKTRKLYRMIRNNLRALDAAGQDIPVKLQGSSGSLSTGKITAHFKVARDKDNLQTGPVTLLVKVPTDIRTVKIPFEFTDIPLP